MLARIAIGGQERGPLGRAAVEGVAVDVAAHAGHAPGRGELPEHPLAVGVALLGLGRGGADPVGVIGQLVFQHVLVEGDVRIDDRPLAGIGLHLIQHVADHRQRLSLGQLLRALGRMAVPLHVEHRGEGGRVVGHVALEPGHLVLGRAAPEHEVVGAPRHPGPPRPVPVLAEALVHVVAALRRLDEGELRARRLDRGPVDRPLPLRDVDALDRVALGPRHAGMGLHVALGGIEVVLRGAGREPGYEQRGEPALQPGAGRRGGSCGVRGNPGVLRHRWPATSRVRLQWVFDACCGVNRALLALRQNSGRRCATGT